MSLIKRVKPTGWQLLEIPTPVNITTLERNISKLQSRFAIRNWKEPAEINAAGSPSFNGIAYGKLMEMEVPAWFIVGDVYTDTTDSSASYTVDGINFIRLVDPDIGDELYTKFSPVTGKGYLVCGLISPGIIPDKVAYSSGDVSNFWTNSDFAVGTAGCQSVYFSELFNTFYVSFSNGTVWRDRFDTTPGTFQIITVPTSWTSAVKTVDNGAWAESENVVIGAAIGSTFLRSINNAEFEEISSPDSGAVYLTYNKHWNRFYAAYNSGFIYWSDDDGDTWNLIDPLLGISSPIGTVNYDRIISFGEMLLTHDTAEVPYLLYTTWDGTGIMNWDKQINTDLNPNPSDLKVGNGQLALLIDDTYFQLSHIVGNQEYAYI